MLVFIAMLPVRAAGALLIAGLSIWLAMFVTELVLNLLQKHRILNADQDKRALQVAYPVCSFIVALCLAGYFIGDSWLEFSSIVFRVGPGVGAAALARAYLSTI